MSSYAGFGGDLLFELNSFIESLDLDFISSEFFIL